MSKKGFIHYSIESP